MEISIRVLVAVIVVIIVALVIISLTTQMGSGANSQVQGIFNWISGILKGSPQ